jgi:uncharacterized protein YqeY
VSLYERVEHDLFDARKQRDELALTTLGMLKSEIVQAGKEPGAGAVTDDEAVIRVLRKEVKRREEALKAYRDAGRSEAATKEEAESALLRRYLPAEMSDTELEAELRIVIAEVKPEGPRDFGAVMKAASARLAGRVEGARIATLAKKLLA